MDNGCEGKLFELNSDRWKYSLAKKACQDKKEKISE
jgi:hypothetical protein